MSKVLVIYESKYGSTKRYAETISKNLQADIQNVRKIKKEILNEYDTIIFASAIYAGSIRKKDFIINNIDILKNKKVAIIVNGISPDDNQEYISNMFINNFNPDLIKGIRLFYARGRIDYKKLKFVDKIIMSMIKKTIDNKNPEQLTQNDKQILNTYGEILNFEDINYVLPLIEYVKGE